MRGEGGFIVTTHSCMMNNLLLQQLPVIQSNVIVRCRSCRTYINPFVVFVDQRRWKCNLCFRVNDCKFILSVNKSLYSLYAVKLISEGELNIVKSHVLVCMLCKVYSTDFRNIFFILVACLN